MVYEFNRAPIDRDLRHKDRRTSPFSSDRQGVKGSNEITLTDVYVGEVWIGSGQSNMVWPLERSRDAEKEIAAADFPKIRYFKVKLTVADERQDDVEGEWQAVSLTGPTRQVELLAEPRAIGCDSTS